MTDVIVAQYPKDKLRAEFVTNIVGFTFIGWLVVLLAVLYIQSHLLSPPYEFSSSSRIPVYSAAAVPAFVFGLWFAIKEANKGYWRLTNVCLFRGVHGQEKFPLASIKKIIVGLPANTIVKAVQMGKLGKSFEDDSLWKRFKDQTHASTVKENSLLICFEDGSWLPLQLYPLPNGRALMDALKDLCKDRVVESYEYSMEEVQRLRRHRLNELIPANVK